MLTAKAAEIDRVLGLELGADDYVAKPFSPRELVLRVRKLVERRQMPEQKADHFTIGDLSLDIPRHLVTVAGKRVDLTATEFKLLTTLMQHRGRVQSRDQLLQDVLAIRQCDRHPNGRHPPFDACARNSVAPPVTWIPCAESDTGSLKTRA